MMIDAGASINVIESETFSTIKDIKQNMNLHKPEKSRDATFCEHTHAQLKKTTYDLKYISRKKSPQKFSDSLHMF